MNDFRADLSKIADKIHGKTTELCRGTARVLYNEMSTGGKVSPGTPIKTGFHRRHWDAQVGGIPAMGEGDADARVEAAIEGFEPGETLYTTNNGPAIRRLEFDGWSMQAPDGFVRPTAEAIQPIVEEVAAFVAAR